MKALYSNLKENLWFVIPFALTPTIIFIIGILFRCQAAFVFFGVPLFVITFLWSQIPSFKGRMTWGQGLVLTMLLPVLVSISILFVVVMIAIILSYLFPNFVVSVFPSLS